MRFAKKKYFLVFGPEPPAPTPPTETPPPAPPVENPPKMLAQAEVDKIVQERLAVEQKKFQKERGDLLSKVEKLNLDSQQKAKLEQELEEIRIQSLSKEEQAKLREGKLQKDLEAKINTEKAEKERFLKIYAEEKIARELTDAAVLHDAFNPSQMAALLNSNARLADELDADNKPTGKYITRVKHVAIKDGKPIPLDLTPAEAVKAMKDEPERYGNLFKAGVTAGLGASGPKTGGKERSLEDMPMDEFVKKYRTDPQSIGLKTRN